MVKLAERKLWSDQDVTTAIALLKSADATLAGLGDPSLLGVRRALTEDIATLSALNQIDFDGIILQLNQLANQVDDLRLADNDSDEAPMDQDDGELSASLSQWRQNLAKSWHSFISEFITIRRRDSSAEPLLAPSQDVYLRENIRSRLLIAAQAIPRHQNQIYQQSLESVSAWVRAYFDVNDPSTKAFLNQIDALSQQSVSMILPDALKSQPLLDKLLHARSHALTAAPTAPATQGNDHAQGSAAVYHSNRRHRARSDAGWPSGVCADPDRQLHIETSVTSLVIMLILLMLALFALEWLLRRLLRTGARTRGWFIGRKRTRARRQTCAGLLKLTEGDYGQVEKLLARNADHADQPLVNYLLAAEAAQQRGDELRANQYLERAAEVAGSDPLPVDITRVRLQLARGENHAARHGVDALLNYAPRHPEVLRLAEQAYLRTDAFGPLLEILPALAKQGCTAMMISRSCRSGPISA